MLLGLGFRSRAGSNRCSTGKKEYISQARHSLLHDLGNRLATRREVQCLLCFLLGLAILGDNLRAAESYNPNHDHFDVRLISPTTPSRGVFGVTQISLTGIGFQDGILEPNEVLISLAPALRSAGPSESTHPSAVTNVQDRSRSFIFVIPMSIAVTKPSDYSVKVSGKYCDGRSFDSDVWAHLTVEPPSPPPTLGSVSPNSGQPGTSCAVTITGNFTHFVTGTTRASFGPGISVGSEMKDPFGPVTIRSPTSITAQIRIDPSAPPGQRTIVVQNSGEKVTLNNGFTVSSVNTHNPNAPTPSIVIPASLDFGSVRVGSSLTKSIPIQNTGTAALQIQNIKTSPFASPLSNLAVQPGQRPI